MTATATSTTNEPTPGNNTATNSPVPVAFGTAMGGRLGGLVVNVMGSGIAAALGPGDTPEQHLHDTLVAGAGACDLEAVEDRQVQIENHQVRNAFGDGLEGRVARGDDVLDDHGRVAGLHRHLGRDATLGHAALRHVHALDRRRPRDARHRSDALEMLRLRRAERAHPDDRDISTVRAEIERGSSLSKVLKLKKWEKVVG